MPLLACDGEGWRLGYGGGFYDRTLEDLRRRRAVTAIGVVFDLQLVLEVPHAADDHQTINAQAFEKAGAGWLVPQPQFTAATLAARIETCFAQPATLSRMAKNARLTGAVRAAEQLADKVAAMMQTTQTIKEAA